MAPQHPWSQPRVRPFRSHRNNHRVGSAWLVRHGNCSNFFHSQCSFLKGPPRPPFPPATCFNCNDFWVWGGNDRVWGAGVGRAPSQSCPPSCARQPCASQQEPWRSPGRPGQGLPRGSAASALTDSSREPGPCAVCALWTLTLRPLALPCTHLDGNPWPILGSRPPPAASGSDPERVFRLPGPCSP